jgi:hypothetical protein
MDNNLKEYYKEQVALMKKHRLLPNKYTGQIILIFNQGGIRNALRGQSPRPLKTESNTI